MVERMQQETVKQQMVGRMKRRQMSPEYWLQKSWGYLAVWAQVWCKAHHVSGTNCKGSYLRSEVSWICITRRRVVFSLSDRSRVLHDHHDSDSRCSGVSNCHCSVVNVLVLCPRR